jgi:hypothetical protein
MADRPERTGSFDAEELRRLDIALTQARRNMRDAHENIRKLEELHGSAPHGQGLWEVVRAREAVADTRSRYKEALQAYVRFTQRFSSNES